MKNFVKSTLIISVGNLLNKACAMLFFIIVAKKLTTDEYGQLRYLIAISFIYALPVTGISSALTRYIGSNIKNLQEIKSYTSHAFIISILLYLITIPVAIFQIESWFFLILLVAAAIVDSFYISFINGLSNFTKMFGYKTIQNIFQFIIILFLYLKSEDFNIKYVIIIYTISCFVSILILEIYRSELKFSPLVSSIKFIELTKFGMLAMMGSVSWTIMFGINMIWLKSFHGASAVAEYSVAETIASIFSILSTAISAIILPKIAEQRDPNIYIKPLYILVVSYIASSLIILIPLVFFKNELIGIIFSDNYIGAAEVLLPISIATILISTHVILAAVYFGLSKPTIPAISISVGCLSNIVLSYFLVKNYGASGGGLSNLLSSFIALVLISFHFLVLLNRKN